MKLIGIFSFCEADEHYIEGMKLNLPCVDEWIANDNRGSDHLWYHEGNIRNKLVHQAIAAGADWIIGCDPDERYEFKASQAIREVVDADKQFAYEFRFREMYTPSQYRIDGIWGKKRRIKLWKVRLNAKYENRKLHSAWHDLSLPAKSLNLNIYHLKMIDPAKREKRKVIYKKVDTESIQKDYDYLTDETGIKLANIQTGRKYV